LHLDERPPITAISTTKYHGVRKFTDGVGIRFAPCWSGLVHHCSNDSMPYPSSAPSSILALVTTVHVTLVLLRLRGNRTGGWAMALPSFALSAAAWLLPTAPWLLAGVAADAAWFVLCERLTARRARVSERDDGWEHRFVPLRVLAARDECTTIRTLRLSRPPGFEFRSGQFLTLQVDVGGRAHVRCYSISSSPDANYLEISVRRQGLVSGLLHATVGVGSEVMARRPAGRFVYPSDTDRPLVLVAGGIGITPLISMVRHAVSADRDRPLTLFYSVRQPGDVAFRDELVDLQRAHPRLRVVMTLTGSLPLPEGFRRGRIDPRMVAEMVSEPEGAVYMICGPLPMLESARELLARIGVPGEHVRFEAFEAAAAAGAKVPGGDYAGTGRLTLNRSHCQVEVSAGETLLDAAEKASAGAIPSVCRSGVCGTCRTRLLDGRARCTSEALASDERERGYVLPCVTWADGDCVLEA
jgi:ferredoxin-NADP reductase